MNYVDGAEEEVIWHPTVRNMYIGTTVMKIFLELFFLHNLYILQRIQNNADRPVDDNHNPIEPLTFSEVWVIPDRYFCHLGQEAHSACSQVRNNNPSSSEWRLLTKNLVSFVEKHACFELL